jgi:16S rRNA processing protein RimM
MPALERIAVGFVHGIHGLRGAVRVEVLSDEPARFAVGSVLFVEGSEQPLTITWTGPAKPGILVRFEGLSTRESVDDLRGRYLEVTPDAPLPEGSWYWHELRGLEVTTTGGDVLGSVADVFRAGEGEVYVVQGGPLGELLVPAVRDVVIELDPVAGRVVVDPVALDLPSAPPRRRRRHEVTRRSRKAARAAARAERGDPGRAPPDADAPAPDADAPAPDADTP